MIKGKYKFNFKRIFLTLVLPAILLVIFWYFFVFSRSNLSTLMSSINSNSDFSENIINYDTIKIDINPNYSGVRSKKNYWKRWLFYNF